jgi:hypothetical protein
MYGVKRIVIACLILAGCGSAAASGLRPPATWRPWIHVSGPVDVVGPRSDGRMVLAANGRLWLLARSGVVRPFAPVYRSNPGLEAYIALSPGSCFGRDAVYAIALSAPRGITVVSAHGQVRHFATISTRGLINGITFGAGRLWATINHRKTTTVDVIDCHGKVTAITNRAPRVEGGIAVAPPSFGRFAGDLIAPDEIGGSLFAITPAGRSLLVARSGLPHGPDTGVESEAFVPRGRHEGLLADRRTPGNRHPGDDVILRLPSPPAGALLVASEAGAQTTAVRCGSSGCQARKVAIGPAIAHAEGHIAFW